MYWHTSFDLDFSLFSQNVVVTVFLNFQVIAESFDSLGPGS